MLLMTSISLLQNDPNPYKHFGWGYYYYYGFTIRILVQADHKSQFDRDSPGLECDVPVSRKGTFGTHLCLQKAALVGTKGIICDFSLQFPAFLINVIASVIQARITHN